MTFLVKFSTDMVHSLALESRVASLPACDRLGRGPKSRAYTNAPSSVPRGSPVLQEDLYRLEQCPQQIASVFPTSGTSMASYSASLVAVSKERTSGVRSADRRRRSSHTSHALQGCGA
eukprot:3733898-Amphidinium_carterae.1